MSLPHTDLREVARPILQALADDCGETAHLASCVGTDVVVTDVVSGPHIIRAHAEPGQRVQLHASALGRAVLAWLSPAEQRTLLPAQRFPALTPRTMTARNALLRSLAAVRERGYSVDLEEFEDGMRCVGTPVRDQTGNVVAAISISAPRHRLPEESIESIAAIVCHHADETSFRLGSPLPPPPPGTPGCRPEGER